jgi:Tol biopolymer transport system component
LKLALLPYVAVFALLGLVGATPTTFAPIGLADSQHIMDPTFSPDGSTLYVTVIANQTSFGIGASARKGDQWLAPQMLPFSGTYRDLEETLSADGRTMIFASNRPAREGGAPIDGMWGGKIHPASGGNLWSVTWNGQQWSAPVRLPDAVNQNDSTFSPALAPDGTLFYMEASGPDGKFHLMMSRLENGQYQPGAPAPFADPTAAEFDPVVAPDGSYVIFSSTRPPIPEHTSALLITFRKGSSWSTPQPLAAAVPSGANPTEARISVDGSTLYYSSRGDLYQTPLQVH